MQASKRQREAETHVVIPLHRAMIKWMIKHMCWCSLNKTIQVWAFLMFLLVVLMFLVIKEETRTLRLARFDSQSPPPLTKPAEDAMGCGASTSELNFSRVAPDRSNGAPAESEALQKLQLAGERFQPFELVDSNDSIQNSWGLDTLQHDALATGRLEHEIKMNRKRVNGFMQSVLAVLVLRIYRAKRQM